MFTEDGGVRRSLSATWADKCVHSMKLLGQKLSLRLEEEGLPLLLGEGDALEAAVTQLTKLQANLCRLTSAGLPAAVRHQLWLLASTGAVTHLMACPYFKPGQLGRLDALQRKHLEWIAQRPVDELTTAIARLPPVRGGIGLSDFGQRAPAVFLAAQSRLLPATATLLELGSAGEVLALDPALQTQIAEARVALQGAGCLPMHLQFGPAAPTAAKTTKGEMNPQHHKSVTALKAAMDNVAKGRFIG